MDVAGRNCGPQTADHHFPHSSSESLRIMAGEITAEMNAGVRIRVTVRWLPILVFDRWPATYPFLSIRSRTRVGPIWQELPFQWYLLDFSSQLSNSM